MEIRARIGLEVAKFQANAKIVTAQFKAMGVGADRFQRNVDHFANRSLQKQKQTLGERSKAEDAIGSAILAQVKKRADDEYSIRMQFVRRFNKDRSKAEQDAIRPGGSGVPDYSKVRGVKHGPNVERGVFVRQEREAVVSAGRIQKAFNAAGAGINKTFNNATNNMQRGFRSAGVVSSRAIQSVAASSDKAREDIHKMVNAFDSREFEQRAAVMRHAIGDVGRRVFAMGVAMTGAFALAVKGAADFESAFTSVERTAQLVGAEAEGLRKTLLRMSREIPVAFQDITEVTKLGAQLGIATKDLESFTESVIRFSVLSGIAADQVGLSFGRLAQLTGTPISQIENLSSAIAFAGINAVATDTEIIKMGESIGAAANLAGLAADETVGFATALASLRVRPEEARGVFVRLFRTFDIEAGRAGERMSEFAKVVGTSKDEAIAMLREDPSKFFQSFLRGAQATGKLNETMRALGITNTRELNVLIRLSENMGVVEGALKNASDAFADGTFAAEAFGLVADDLNSKFTNLKNSMEELSANFGELFSKEVGGIVDVIQKLVNGLTDAPKGVRVFLAIAAGLTGALAVLSGVVALGVAGLLALKIGFRSIGKEGIKMGLGIKTLNALLVSLIAPASGATTVFGALKASMFGVTGAAVKTSFALRAVGLALPIFGLVSIAVLAIGTALGVASREADNASRALTAAAGGAEAVIEAVLKDTASGTGIERLVTDVRNLTDAQKESRMETAEATLKNREAAEMLLRNKAAFLTTTEEITANSKALAEQVARTQEARDAIAELNGELETNSVLFGKNTMEVVLNALAKTEIENLGNKTVLRAFRDIDPASKAVLEEFGIDLATIINNSAEGVDGEAFAANFTNAIDILQHDYLMAGRTIEEAQKRFKLIGIEVDDSELQALIDKFEDPEFRIDSAQLLRDLGGITKAVDDTFGHILELISDLELRESVAEALGLIIGDADEELVDFNNELRQTIKLLTSQDVAEQRVADAFEKLAESARETNGELDGLGESARKNMSNFASAMDAAVEAAVSADEGTVGAAGRIVAILRSLEEQGINTTEMFARFKPVAIDALTSVVPELGALYDSLNQEQSLDGMESVIRGFFAMEMAAATSINHAIAIERRMNAAIAVLNGFGKSFQVQASSVTKDAGKTQTALEKLQESLKSLFETTNVRMKLQESIASLGKSLQENGKVFSAWSDSGRSNISSLLGTIDQLAVKSKGNLQTFANDLASLRAALVQMGVPASGLRLIDAALRDIGKTGKASKSEVKRFMAELKDTSEAERALLRLVKAVSDLQSGIRAGLSAQFSFQKSIDDITLGWLDLSDAAESAAESIKSAQKAITDAQRAIDDARVSIAGLAADKNKLEFQLQIALKYGDTLRASQLRAELEKVDSDIAKEQEKIANSQESISNSYQDIRKAESRLGIDPGTRDIIERNRALQDMASKYGDVAAQVLLNAKPGENLNAIIEEQVEAFKQNAIQMGFAEEEAEAVAKVLREELVVAMESIPKDISTLITAETDGALKNINSFARQATDRLNSIPRNITTTHTVVEQAVRKTVPGSGTQQVPHHLGFARFATGGLVSGPGSATSDSIVARLSSGEFVVKASAVQRYGLDFFNSLNQMRAVPASIASAPASMASGPQMVHLSPEDRQLLRAAIDRPVNLFTDNATIAKSANDGNKLLAQRGLK